jgi:hypothetical protein
MRLVNSVLRGHLGKGESACRTRREPFIWPQAAGSHAALVGGRGPANRKAKSICGHSIGRATGQVGQAQIDLSPEPPCLAPERAGVLGKAVRNRGFPRDAF